MKKSEILYRRQQSWQLFVQGYNQKQIADKQDVSLRTVATDFEHIKNDAKEWFDSLTAGQLQVYSKSNFDSLERIKYELWKIFENATNETIKIKILNTISSTVKSSSEITSGNLVLRDIQWLHKTLGGKTISESVNLLWKIGEKILDMGDKIKKCNNGEDP